MAIPMPAVTLRAALASDPLASSPSYTDLSTYLIGGDVAMGRQDSLQQFEPGRATFVFDNSDRRFDPFHTSGPYTTTFRPGKRVNLRGVWSSTTYDVFTGYIDRVRLVWPSHSRALAGIDVIDGFSILARKKLVRDSYRSEVMANTPIAYYRMHDLGGAEVMTDSSGNSRHGTYTGGGGKTSAPGGVYGDAGESMNCGLGERGGVGPTAAGMSGSSVRGVDFLFMPSALPPTGAWTLFQQATTTSPAFNWFTVFLNNTGTVQASVNGTNITSSGTVKLNAWNYVAAVIDGSGNLRLRLNNASVQTASYGGGSFTQNAPHIGEDYVGTVTFKGYIDEVAIYNGSIPTDSNTLTHFGWSSAALNDQLGHSRLTSLLDHIGWPGGDRNLSVSTHTLAPVVEPLANSSALDHFYDVARTEYGLLYMDGQGRLTLSAEMPTSPPSSVATFGEGSGEIHYREGPEADYSWEFVANQVSLENIATSLLNPALASDATSITAYSERTLSQSGLLFRDQSGIDGRATRLLADRKDPKKRIRSVTVAAQDDPNNSIPVMLGTALGATVTAKRVPPGGGSAISVVSLVDGISHRFTADTWVTKFALSPW